MVFSRGAGSPPAPAGMLAAVAAAAFNLRVGIVAIGPVIEQIRADTGMSSTVAGALTTVPFACMSVFAFAGTPLLRRFTATSLIALSIVLVGFGTLLRAVMPTPWLLVLGTVPLGIGVALAGTLLPTVVKQRMPQRAGAATGAYVASLQVGASLTALTIVPLSAALGGWRWAFAASAVLALPALHLWLAASARGPSPAGAPGSGPSVSGRPSRAGLLLAGVFGAQSICFAATVTWVAAIFEADGWSRGHAALATAAISLLAFPAALAVSAFSDRGSRRTWLVGCAVAMTAGLAGLALAPGLAPVAWMLLFGLGCGAMFPLLLTVPVDLGASAAEVTSLTGWMLGLGYGLSVLGPVVVGALRDATGDFRLAFLFVAAAGAISAVLAARLAPR